jgi:glycosyltransferase involved in cell wall biosynthesis
MTPEMACQIAPGRRPAHACGRGEISVVIPARNAEATIGRALRGLACDRGLLREVLLIDDGSDDATAEVGRTTAERWGLPLAVLPLRAGSPGAARNAGIERAAGDFLFFLDADDELMPGGLGRLYERLRNAASDGVAIGASVRRTDGRPDKLKPPAGYGNDRRANAHGYLTNRMWPIAVGTALLRTAAVADLRFPTSADLDEDTCYWAAVLARVGAVTIPDPVLLYLHDELRMSERFTRAPRRTLLAISRELDKLQRFGIERRVLQWRKAWIALRITRQLILRRRFADARGMLRAARSHPAFRWTWKAAQYSLRIRRGTLGQQRRRVRAAGRTTGNPPQAGRLRTLVLTADPAVPPVSGAELRNWQNAFAASQVGPVTIASVRPLRDPPGTYLGRLDVAALSDAGASRGRSLARRRTSVDLRIPRAAASRLVALVRQFRPDAVIVEGLPLFPLLKLVRPLSRLLILDMHNVESRISAQRQRGARRKPLSGIFPDDATRLFRLERKALGIVDRVWVCSRREEDRVRRLFRVGIPVDVVPNGIPRFSAPSELPALSPIEDASPVILFVGHLGYPPNVDAAQRLARAILPRVRRDLPAARLVLAGRFPPPPVEALAAVPGVVLAANPQDVPALLRRAHLTAIPLRWGGGTRLKVLEAMAWGLPVVASPQAVEGLELADGHDVVLAETDDEFAACIVAITRDRRRTEALRRAAHAKAIRRYGPAAIERAVRSGLGLGSAPT